MNAHFLNNVVLLMQVAGIIAVLFLAVHIVSRLVEVGPKGRKTLSDTYDNAASRLPFSMALAGGAIIFLITLFLWLFLDPKSFVNFVDPVLLKHVRW